jgi:uncharacterized protein
MKRQIIFIHGGETFDTYEEYFEYLAHYEIDLAEVPKKRWRDALAEHLAETHELIAPAMPSPKNAKYAEWKLWFEKYLPIIREDAILIGHSLGGIFLAKYLAENTLPKKAKALFLVAAPYDDSDSPYSLADFTLPPSLHRIRDSAERIVLVHSEDDPVVAFADHAKYQAALPEAVPMVFTDRGHFLTESFPEIEYEISLL